jgi:hypothetical protein
LPRKKRADVAMKILGERSQRSDVDVVLDRMEKESKKLKDTRDLGSADLKKEAKKYGAALDKVIGLMTQAPAALRPPPGMGYSVEELAERNKRGKPPVDKPENPILVGVFCSDDELLRQLRVRRQYCQFVGSSKLSQKQQKEAADDKRVTAWGALDLCKMYGIKPSKTKNGTFCRLAAALYGHSSANLLPHCQYVLKKREAWQNAADEVREAWQKKFGK